MHNIVLLANQQITLIKIKETKIKTNTKTNFSNVGIPPLHRFILQSYTFTAFNLLSKLNLSTFHLYKNIFYIFVTFAKINYNLLSIISWSHIYYYNYY